MALSWTPVEGGVPTLLAAMHRISFSQALAATILFSLSVGCGTSHEYMAVSSSAEGELDYTRKEDGGFRLGQLGRTNGVRPFPTCNGTAPCKASVDYGSIEIRFDPPSGVGTHDLEELQAVICQDAWTTQEVCAPILGRLEVTEMVAPCGDEGCGRFQADLVLKPSKTTKAPAVWGETHLSYSERVGTSTTGGCSNFQGG